MRYFCAVLSVQAAIAAGSQADPLLTPAQAKYISEAQAPAVAASKHAETQLLAAFDTAKFKAELALQGAGGRELLKKSAAELLVEVKEALDAQEFLFSFGYDVQQAKLHPGQPAWSIQGIDESGHIPTLWELKVEGKADALPHSQWTLVDAEETGLYRQPEFAKPANPTLKEAALRPSYVSGNLAHFDAGIWEFGFYAPVYRKSALRERAVIMGLDGGGWSTVCNQSASNMGNRWHWVKRFVQCDAIFSGGNKEVVFGTIDNYLHSFYANTETFGIMGGSLARRVFQLLVPGATMHPLEDNMYLEAAFFGPARMEDMKLFVASFPDVFGTPEADDLKAFCKRHGLPLAWAMGGGKLRKDLDKTHKQNWLPFEPFVSWPVNGDRLLDPSSYASVNAEAPAGSADVWAAMEAKAKTARQADGNLEAPIFAAWWNGLISGGGAVRGFRAGKSCVDQMDLCFGTSADNTTHGQCLCRKLANSTALEATTLLV